MFTKVVPLGLAGLASAAPLISSRQVPNYPPTSLSTGFRLIANVTDPSTDLSPSVDNWVFTAIHVGAGLNDATLQADGSGVGNTFYQNGTAEQIAYNQGTIVTDGGTPLAPYSVSVASADETDEAGYHDVTVNVGLGTNGVQTAQFPNVYPIVKAPAQGQYVACNQLEPYYQEDFVTVRYSYAVWNPDTALYDQVVPEGCTAITLVPECAALEDLPAGSLSSHEYATTVNCYEDVSSINWSLYGP
ncbi:hypothetical protein BX600DRAFT_441466 [Xylariales sp. PMI_506]|nr:hypothetical protein BX600DRAFT_441466 [Xylariales sp. PMI_506]